MRSQLVPNPVCWNKKSIEAHVAAVTAHEETVKRQPGCSVSAGYIACTGCNIENDGTRHCTAYQEPTKVNVDPDTPYPNIPDLTRITGFRQVQRPQEPSPLDRITTLPSGWLDDMI
jgi:hypothetical protein